MLIDWVTVRIPLLELDARSREIACNLGDRIARYCPRTGDVRYETQAWDSVRSDSHQISIRCGTSDFWIQGSPARVTGDGCAVFGSGASARLDLAGCVDAMRLFVQLKTGMILPADIRRWLLSRVDVTGNLLLQSLDSVKSALGILRDCNGGRYKVSQQAGDTVYWSHKSKLRSGKAYAKGPHLAYCMKSRNYNGREYTADEIQQASKLLRLELKLAREFWARNNWLEITADELIHEWKDYFSRMIGDAEMSTETDLLPKCIEVAKTPGQGRAAYGCWTMIQSQGWERTRSLTSKTTWYRNLQILRAAGLGDADISRGQVVPLRQKVLTATVINSWAELRKTA